MTATMTELGLHKLNREQLCLLAQEIMDNLGYDIVDVGGNETEDEKRFIDERLALNAADSRPSRPWREVIAELRSRQ